MLENERRIVWIFYILLNTATIYFNLSLIVSILRLKRRTSTDILIGGLASGVCLSALGCGPQCLINVVNGAFVSGKQACFTESYMHLVGMEIQFLSVAAIAYRTFYGIVKVKTFAVRKASATVVFIWVVSVVITAALTPISPYYLVADETFCFYEWRSPVLMYWAWPLAVVCLGSMAYWYYRTWKALQQTGDGTLNVTTELDVRGMEKGLAWRLLFLILMFVMGYAGVIWQSIYELSVGRTPVWGDLTAWIVLLLYWLAVAFAYAHANPSLGLKAVLACKAHQSPDPQEVELSSPWNGPRPSVGIQIKPYTAFHNHPVGGESEDWDMGLDMTRSGYRKRSDADSEDDLDGKTPPFVGLKGSPESSKLPTIPSFQELHSYSPTSKSKNGSSQREPLATPSSGSQLSSNPSPEREKHKTLRLPSFSLEEGSLPEISQSGVSRTLDLVTPPSPSNLMGTSSLFHSLKAPSSQSSSFHLPNPARHSSTSSDEEEGDEVDPIMANTRRKEQQKLQEQQEAKQNGEEEKEVPMVTSLLYTISEEPTPKQTPLSRSSQKPKGFFQNPN